MGFDDPKPSNTPELLTLGIFDTICFPMTIRVSTSLILSTDTWWYIKFQWTQWVIIVNRHFLSFLRTIGPVLIHGFNTCYTLYSHPFSPLLWQPHHVFVVPHPHPPKKIVIISCKCAICVQPELSSVIKSLPVSANKRQQLARWLAEHLFLFFLFFFCKMEVTHGPAAANNI